MEQRRFGLTPRELPVVGVGSWYFDDGAPPVAVAELRDALHLGMTRIDTAADSQATSAQGADTDDPPE